MTSALTTAAMRLPVVLACSGDMVLPSTWLNLFGYWPQKHSRLYMGMGVGCRNGRPQLILPSHALSFSRTPAYNE
jgi:hypothetical protein